MIGITTLISELGSNKVASALISTKIKLRRKECCKNLLFKFNLGRAVAEVLLEGIAKGRNIIEAT